MPHGAIGRACRRLAIVAAALWCAAASAQALTGQAGGILPNGDPVVITYNCSGTPTCTGSYVGIEQHAGCSNYLGESGTITFSGLNLSTVNTLVQGSVTLQNVAVDVTTQADGTCTITPGSQHDKTFALEGVWTGTVGAFEALGTDDQGRQIQFGLVVNPGTSTLPALPTPPAPPFQMTTNVSVNATTANATAQITYPAADVGKTESVFVFALAPRSLVKSLRATPLDGTDTTCVLAQLDPSGHLVQTSASQMQPYVTGVLQAQGQAVTVLNNASTPNVAGASFFVGYGSDGASMVSTGVNRNVTTIPGATQCPAIVPANAGPLSGLWWNPNESGWGIDFVQRRNILFAAWFTYDTAGNPKWYVASDCEMPNPMASSGTCNGDLYEVTAGPFLGVAFDPTKVHVNKVGTLQVNFADASNATMTYTVNGVSRTVPIVRQLFASGSTPPAIDYTDLWWASPANSESGWGMAISHQYNVMFLAWFVYDASGNPVWYVASDCVVSGNGCSGDLFTVTGPPFGPTFNTNLVHPTSVGHITVTFSGPNDGSLSYTIGTTTATKLITRQIF
jgi:hypothetical protein